MKKTQAFHLFSATSSKLEVKWNESFASFDSGLMSANDKMNSSIKYVAATDKNNPDLKGNNVRYTACSIIKMAHLAM